MNAWTRKILLIGQILLISTSIQAKSLYILPKENPLSTNNKAIISSKLSDFNILSVERAFHLKEINRNHRVYRWFKVEVDNLEDIQPIKTRLNSDPSIEIVEENIIRHTCSKVGLDERTNDPLLSHQWYLERIAAFAAWDEVREAEEVVVAVIDNGVDRYHPDLVNKLWRNQAEINGQSGVDDDGNGYIDDKYGWDAYQWDGDPQPNNTFTDGHGTHCAGLIGAESNNGIGIAGVAPNVKIMAVRAGAFRDIVSAPQGIVYAAENGADVISMSFSAIAQSQFEQDAIDFAASHGCILVAAAGNDSDPDPHYPAAYTNVIAVASSDEADYLSNFSNYGYWVDVSAPGSNILSTIIDSYGYMSGTSMAAPIVSGIVASLKGIYPDISKNEAVSRLQFGSEELLGLQNIPLNAGRVNYWRSSVSSHPFIEVVSADLHDPDSVVPQPGEQELDITFKLYTESECDVAINVLMEEDRLYVNHSEVMNNLSAGEFSIQNIFAQTTPNTVSGLNPIIIQMVAQTVGDSWSDEKSVLVSYNSPWRTHNNGGAIATITNFGAIGYWDNIYNREETQGVRLASERIGCLFHGSILVSDGIRVSDAADRIYSIGAGDRDFVGNFEDHVETEESQTFIANLWDMDNPNPVGITIQQTTTSMINEEFVLFEFELQRRNSSTNIDAVFSMFFDWDIGNLVQNYVGFDQTLELSYMYGSTGYAGVTFLGGDSGSELTGAVAIPTSNIFNSDNDKRNFMNQGFENAATSEYDDYAHMINVSVPDVTINESKTVRFAMVLGKTEESFFQNVADARDTYFRNPATQPNTLPYSIELVKHYPNPFNSNINLEFLLPENNDLDISIYNVLGRSIYTFEQIKGNNGRISLNWDGKDQNGRDVSSGVYFLNYNSDKTTGSTKLLLLR